MPKKRGYFYFYTGRIEFLICPAMRRRPERDRRGENGREKEEMETAFLLFQ
jgi:hypothetical protein